MSIISVLPLLLFIGTHLFTCSFAQSYKSLKVCSKLPAETYLFSIILFSTSFRLFLQSLIISKSARYIKELNESTCSACGWIYYSILYILPTTEFFTQAITFSDLIENFEYFINFYNQLKKITEVFKEYPIMQFITLSLYMSISVFYIVPFYKQRHQTQTHWFFVQTILQFLLLSFAQVQKI